MSSEWKLYRSAKPDQILKVDVGIKYGAPKVCFCRAVFESKTAYRLTGADVDKEDFQKANVSYIDVKIGKDKSSF